MCCYVFIHFCPSSISKTKTNQKPKKKKNNFELKQKMYNRNQNSAIPQLKLNWKESTTEPSARAREWGQYIAAVDTTWNQCVVCRPE